MFLLFEMGPQCTWIGACIVTRDAFVWLFSTVCFQMSPQMACSRGGIFTLVAFVNRPIQVIFLIINVHGFVQFDASSFAASVQLTQKREIISLTFETFTILTRYNDKFKSDYGAKAH